MIDMKLALWTSIFVLALGVNVQILAQKRTTLSASRSKSAATKSSEIGKTAVVIDETLSVLRKAPSLFAEPVQRMRRGRKVRILGVAEADGVTFYRVTAPPTNFGWVQADAVFGTFRPTDEKRFVDLVQASSGFDQIESAVEFFDLYPNSKFRAPMLLIYGDLLEETCSKLSKDAGRALKRTEMAASAAPMHSYFLNFVSLDRYRKLGVTFLFNPVSHQFHYDGASWREIVLKFPASAEARDAQKRLDSLKLQMGAAGQK